MGDAYDVVVIGAGTGGYSSALRASRMDKRVAVIERDDRLGGTCLLRGCIPTKALLQSAAVMDIVSRSDEWGIKASGEPDWSAVLGFQEKIVDKNVKGLTGLVSQRGIDVLNGTAKLLPGPTVELDGRPVEAAEVIVASGSAPKLLRGVKLSDRVITSNEALTLGFIPETVVVIGAGAVGLEFASLYRSLGADVTLIEALPRLAPLEDEEVSKEIGRAFRKRGIQSFAGASVGVVRRDGERVEVTFEADGREKSIWVDICLVAVGRGPVTEQLGLPEAGVELTDRGFVKVDASLRTTAPHVWAVGDVADTPLQLAHVAFTEGYAVAERIGGIDVPPIDYAHIPRVTYCTPEIASVGLTEAQAKERGLDIVTEKLDFRGVGKANIVGEGGFVKVVAETDGTVRGIHMIGPHVTDLIAEGMLITSWEASVEDVAALIHPHPTLSEGVGEAFLALAGKPLHSA
jgi:dihydrolipoamide dehydrogenase